MSFNDVAIAYVKGSAYRIHFWYISKNDAISIMSNSNLIDKKGVLLLLLFFLLYISETTYYQRNREVILDRAKDYYENDKERFNRESNIQI